MTKRTEASPWTSPSDEPAVEIGRARVAEVLTLLLQPGIDLYEGLSQALAKASVTRATVMSGIGALQRTTARNVKHFVDAFPITDEDRAFVTVPGPCEIVSLTGWVAPYESGEPHLHLHFAASYGSADGVHLIGGHLSPGACETYVHVAVTFAVHDTIEARYLFDQGLQVERLTAPRETL
jgi:predicted DNA-binding protein with PD1-like motif